jgi:hypothetical protein
MAGQLFNEGGAVHLSFAGVVHQVHLDGGPGEVSNNVDSYP